MIRFRPGRFESTWHDPLRLAAVLLPLLLSLAPAAPGQARSGAPPNVLLIVIDDAGYTDFGMHGSEEFSTPNIDALAREGVRFSAGYVTASVCSPSRAGLLTGRYQQRFGHEANLGYPQPERVDGNLWGLPVGEPTLADHMRARGYRTGAIGKWHLGHQDHFHPEARGFDEFFGLLGGARWYFPYPGEIPFEKRLLRGHSVQPEPEYLTDLLTDAAIDFLERRRAEPFFLYLSYTAVHGPMHGKEEQKRLFPHLADPDRRTLAAMTLALDEGVGRVLEALSSLGLEENTLVFFINDNGGAEVNASVNRPLRGHKGSHFEGGLRVPFLVRWPAVVPAGRFYEEPVSALDVVPTALAAAGAAKIPENLDGVDLLPYVRGERQGRPHDALFWRRGPVAAVREGNWKLIRIDSGPVLLFDLASDPGERLDVADARPVKVRELLERIARWEEGLTEPLWSQSAAGSRNQIEHHLRPPPLP